MTATFGWTERTDGQGASIDKGKTGQASRRFILDVDTNPLAVAYKPESFLGGITGAEPLPQHGSGHPNYPALKLDRYDVEREGYLSVAVALYSNDGRFQYPSIPEPQVESEVRYMAGREDVHVTVPLIIEQNITQALPPQATGDPLSKRTFDIDDWTFAESRIKEMWTVLLKTDQVQPALRAMNKQNNHIHFAENQWRRFQAGDIVGSGNKDFPYQTTYTWHLDPGTNPDGSTIVFPPYVRLPDQQVNHLPGSGPALMLRPPFTELVAVKSNDASFIPVVAASLSYIVDPSGWAELVGL